MLFLFDFLNEFYGFMNIPFCLFEILNYGILGLTSGTPEVLERISMTEVCRRQRANSGLHRINALDSSLIIVLRVINLFAHASLI